MVTTERGLNLDALRVVITHEPGPDGTGVVWIELHPLDAADCGRTSALLCVLPAEMPALVDVLRAAIDDHLAWRWSQHPQRRRPTLPEPHWVSGWKRSRLARWP